MSINCNSNIAGCCCICRKQSSCDIIVFSSICNTAWVLKAINTSCDELVQVVYESNNLEETAFFSLPYYCGKNTEGVSMPLMFDEETSRCKVRFSHGSQSFGKETNFLFDYSTRSKESDEEVIWPVKPPTIADEPTTPDLEVTHSIEQEFTTTEINHRTSDDGVSTASSANATTAESIIDNTTTVEEVKTTTVEKLETTTVDEHKTTTVEETKTTTLGKPEITTVEKLETTTVEEPETTTFEELETTTVDKLETTTVEELETTTVDEHKTTTVEELETTIVDKLETTTVDEHKTTTVKELETATVEEPETTTVDKLETTTVDKLETTTVDEHKTTTVKEPDTTTVDELETTTVDEPKTTTVEELETTTVEELETTTVEEPETTTVDKLETTTIDKLETTTVDEPDTTTTAKFKPTTKATKTPASTMPSKQSTSLDCTCSLGFEQDGSHQLLRDFPNALPEGTYTINVPDVFKDPCLAAKEKCDAFCKLYVTTRVNNIGGLRQIIVRQDFLKLLKISASQRPKLQGTIGEFVCEDYKSKLLGDGAELYVYSHLPQCGFRPQEVHLLEKNFCCDGKGQNIKCSGPPRVLPCKCVLTVFKNYDDTFIGTALPPPTNITVSSTEDCDAGMQKCKQYCKNTNQYRNLLRSGANTYSYTKSDPFSSSYFGRSVGDRICEVEKNIYSGNRAKLLLTSDLKTCTNMTSSIVATLDTGYFCCNNKRYTKKCDASYTTASKPPKIYTTKSAPYYSTTPKSSQTIKCQCVPVYLNNGVEQLLSAAYTVTVSFTKGCYSAQQLCKQSCTRFVVKPISGLPLNTNLVTGIKNNACRRLYKPIYYTGKSSQLKLYSMLDNRQCSSSRYRSYIRTLDNNFCCSGGTSSYYRKCKAGSGSTYYPYNSTYKPYFSTTYKPFNSTYRPNASTKKPSTVYRSSCDCYVGLRYSGYSTIFQNIRASDVSNEFKVKPTVASTRYSCATFSSICNSLCQSRLEKVVKQKKAAITPYGTIGIDSAICKKLRRSITKEIDFVVRSRPSTCTTSLRTGKFYDQNFCCNIYGTTSTCQKNVIG